MSASSAREGSAAQTLMRPSYEQVTSRVSAGESAAARLHRWRRPAHSTSGSAYNFSRRRWLLPDARAAAGDAKRCEVTAATPGQAAGPLPGALQAGAACAPAPPRMPEPWIPPAPSCRSSSNPSLKEGAAVSGGVQTAAAAAAATSARAAAASDAARLEAAPPAYEPSMLPLDDVRREAAPSGVPAPPLDDVPAPPAAAAVPMLGS